MASLGEERKSSMVTTQTYLDYLGFGWKHQRECPHARQCGSESATALTVVFNVGEAMVRREIITEARLHP